MGVLVAVASTDNIVINQHFGHTDRFYIYEVDESGGNCLIEERRVQPPCSFGEHDEFMMEKAIEAIHDCRCVVCSRIGVGALVILHAKGIKGYERKDYIKEVLAKLCLEECKGGTLEKNSTSEFKM